jgi:hypothetical protein
MGKTIFLFLPDYPGLFTRRDGRRCRMQGMKLSRMPCIKIVLYWVTLDMGFPPQKIKSGFLFRLRFKLKGDNIEIPFLQQDVWFKSRLKLKKTPAAHRSQNKTARTSSGLILVKSRMILSAPFSFSGE